MDENMYEVLSFLYALYETHQPTIQNTKNVPKNNGNYGPRVNNGFPFTKKNGV